MTVRALLEADELLPCPFCGGKAKLSDYECGKAGMPMNYRNPRCTRCGVSFGYAKMDQAVSMWNRRTIASSLEGQAVRCDAIPKHDWQELSCEPGLYEPSMESGYKRCTLCGTRVHFIRERTDQSKDKPA